MHCNYSQASFQIVSITPVLKMPNLNYQIFFVGYHKDQFYGHSCL